MFNDGEMGFFFYNIYYKESLSKGKKVILIGDVNVLYSQSFIII